MAVINRQAWHPKFTAQLSLPVFIYMKSSPLIRLLLLLLIAFTTTYCHQDGPDPISIKTEVDSLTVAQTRSLKTYPVPSSIYITDAGKQGLFKLYVADEHSADNTGTILVTKNNRRYIRDFIGAGNAGWFGVETTDTDIGPELQTAVNTLDDIIIPDGAYTQLTTVRLRSNMTLRSNAGKVTITLPQTYVSLANAIDPSIFLQNVLIDGLSWNVTSQQTGTFGTIYIDGPSVANLTVQNCSSTDAISKDSTNWFTLKIPAGKTAANITVQNNNVQARRMACEIFNHDNYNVYAGKVITVSNNNFHDCHFGISLSGPLTNLTVDNNYIRNCSLFGIEIAGAAQVVTITNNQFEGIFDKFLEGSNDGNGNGSIVGGMTISGNKTIGFCTGGIQLFNGGTVSFTKNQIQMTGILELAHSTAGGTFTDNSIESTSNKTIICDNSPNNTFSGNTISNQTSAVNQATFLAYGSAAINNTLTNNIIIKGKGGTYYDAVLGGSVQASANRDGQGNPLP